MEPWTDWLTEERHLNGMVDLLKGMLQHLGVRPEHVQFTAQIRRDWDPAVVMLYIDAVQTAAPGVPFPAVHLVATSPTVPWGIQKAAISAIKVIGCDYRAYLQHSEFRLFPRLLPTAPHLHHLEREMQEAPFREADLCTTALGRFVLLQDAYLSSLE